MKWLFGHYIDSDVLQVIVAESVSSLLGVEGSEGLTQRADDDSLSAESLDSVSHGKEKMCFSVFFSCLTSCFYEGLVCLKAAFTPKSVCPVRHRLTVQPVPVPPSPHRHLQPRQLESPSHTANANGRGAAIGSDGVT